MALKPISFRWKPIGPKLDLPTRIDGLSAQNVRASFPDATFGEFDAKPKADGDIDFPGSVDDRGVLAHVICACKTPTGATRNCEARIAALEAA